MPCRDSRLPATAKVNGTYCAVAACCSSLSMVMPMLTMPVLADPSPLLIVLLAAGLSAGRQVLTQLAAAA